MGGGMSNLDFEGSAHSDSGGSKTSLMYIWRRLGEMGHSIPKLVASIGDVCLSSLVGVEHAIPHQPNAFHVFGFDVILDHSLRPWLLEVNSAPALALSSDLDERIKVSLLQDTISLVSPPRFDRRALLSVLERRMKKNQQQYQQKDAAESAASWKEMDDGAREEVYDELQRVLLGTHRGYGEMPEHLGGYTRLCPGTSQYKRILQHRYQAERASLAQYKRDELAGKEQEDRERREGPDRIAPQPPTPPPGVPLSTTIAAVKGALKWRQKKSALTNSKQGR